MPNAAMLRSTVKGWGADLELRNRPGVPREINRESVLTSGGDDYDKIPRQTPRVEILVSTEHKKLTPVFGTACPPKGLSGVVRRLAFRFSEGKKAHWMLLLFADRVDVVESAVSGMLRGHSHNPFKEMGLRAEFRKGGFFSRFGHGRADTKRWAQQSLLLATVGGAAVLLYRSRHNKNDQERLRSA
jgi:hypothetical protein